MTHSETSPLPHDPVPRLEHTGELQPGRDLLDYAKQYAKEKPEVVALWCFGIGFVLGWKLKPW